MNRYIIKRDGRKVQFKNENILNVVKKVLNSIHPDDVLTKSEEHLAENLTKDIILEVQEKLDPPTVEGVQDIVQDILIRNSLFNEAKNFIEYRQKRTAIREFNDDITKTYRKMSESSSKDMDLMRENANINGDATMGLMLRFGSEACKDFTTKYILKPEWSFAHKNGDFHMHDLDFSRLCWNCCQIDLTKLFHHGFSTGHGYLREPSSIRTASALACIALQSNQNDMFGGQSIAKFDYDLAPYVAKTYAINLCKVIEDIHRSDLNEDTKNTIKSSIFKLYNKLNSVTKNTIFGQNLEELKSIIAKYVKAEDVDYAYNRALKLTDNDTFQAMEALVHNLNTMQSRCGAQTPFSSINYGTCTTEEGRLVTKNVLLATQKGLGRGETPIFPVQIFKMKKGVNYEKGEPNFDLFELACKVTAKRLFPNFLYIDAPQNLQYYKEGRPETELAVMGCSFRDETITFKYKNKLYNNVKISDAFDMLKTDFGLAVDNGKSEYVKLSDVKILDDNGLTECKGILKNHKVNNWTKVKTDVNELILTDDHPLSVNGKRTFVKDINLDVENTIVYNNKKVKIASIEKLDLIDDSFDVETASDKFLLSNVVSHNCRTRTIGNAVHPEDAVVTGRGNFSFTTINLPRLGIECKGDWNAFYTKLDNLMQLAREQLKERFENICKKHVYNYPFLLGQHVWIHSEDLKPTDEVRKILDQSSISIGFIGLAECLKAMTGKHHGESEESNRLGHEILDHMNNNLSRYTKEDHLNWSLFATPAEGLSGRFVKLDAKRYGKIPGVTDRDYYTNSFHIPVYYDISAEEKIKLEGPYHAQCNAGSISYVEVDGDPSNNIKALEKLVKYAGESNMNYFSINHPVDRCPVCGYTGIINDVCPQCGRKEFEAVSIEKLRSAGCDCSIFED